MGLTVHEGHSAWGSQCMGITVHGDHSARHPQSRDQVTTYRLVPSCTKGLQYTPQNYSTASLIQPAYTGSPWQNWLKISYRPGAKHRIAGSLLGHRCTSH